MEECCGMQRWLVAGGVHSGSPRREEGTSWCSAGGGGGVSGGGGGPGMRPTDTTRNGSSISRSSSTPADLFLGHAGGAEPTPPHRYFQYCLCHAS